MPSGQGGQGKRLPRIRGRSLVKTVLGLALLVIIVLFGWHIYSSSKNVVIGKTTITPKQVNELRDEITQYTKKNKNVSFGKKSPHTVARDDLILNAALKNEADKYDVKITQADIDKTQANQYHAYGSKADYESFIKYEGITKFNRVTAENDTYEAKLEDKIIAKKKLFITAIIYDTPYINGSTNPSSATLRARALKTMQNKFLPLFQQDKSDKAISANVNIGPNAKNINNSIYFNSVPSTAFYVYNCTTAKPCLNDVKSKPLAGLPNAVSTQSEIDKLTKVGQHTGVINSEAGFVGIIRLAGKTTGNYNSWDQFLKSYENKYAKGKLLATLITPPNKLLTAAAHYIDHYGSLVSQQVENIVFKKASADVGCSDNVSHFVTIDISAQDPNGNPLSGVHVTETRNNAACPVNGHFVDSQGGPNHSPNSGNTNGSGNLTFSDNCYNSRPTISQSPPSSNYSLSYVYATDGNPSHSYTAIVGNTAPGGTLITEANAIDVAQANTGVWSGGVLNAAGSVSIVLHYKQATSTDWKLTSTSTVDGVQGTIHAAPGSHHTFKHTVHNNGPDAATYNWSIKDKNNGGGWSGTGINSGGNIKVGNNNYGPDGTGGSQQGYNVPNGAHNGDKYCMRIDYSHANGPTDGSNTNSSPACVVVDTGYHQPPTATYGCNNAVTTHASGYITYTTISGTDSDGTYETDPGGPDLNLTMTPTHKDVSITTDVWHNTNAGTGNPPHWVELPGNPQTPIVYHCLHAACSPGWVDGDGPVDGTNPDSSPHHIVQAGHSFKVYMNVTNDNTAVVAQPIQSNAGGHDFSLTEPPDQYTGSLMTHNVGFGLGKSESEVKEIDFDANSNTNKIGDITLDFYPDYYQSEHLGDKCSIKVTFYQYFSASLSASSDPLPTAEHPYKGDDYNTAITVSNDLSHNVNVSTQSEFYKLPASGAKSVIDSSTGGAYGVDPPYPSSSGGKTTTTLSGHYDIPAGSYVAGDEYCAHIHADYTTGYVGPDNGVIHQEGADDAYSCPRVVNEPYFKVFNSSISAGGDFNQCSTDGGTLAGYADINDPPGATRGSSTQLSALALVKITGFASAQSPGSINGSPTKLTFANTGVQVDSGGNESPVLGGQFGGCRTLTNEIAPASASNFGGATFPISGKKGAYKHSGNLTINGGTLGSGQNVSMFVDGDVYISSDISYGDNWQAGTAPSLVVHATGNIYIAGNTSSNPGVTQLAGVYIAQNKIYTCADTSNHFSPMSATNLYNGCKNQLMVTGSFVAKQINLMRSFGSLRDEEPNAAAAPVPSEPAPTLYYSSCGSFGNPQGGEPCLSASPAALGLRCVDINEPSDPSGWYDNKLCIANSSDIHMYWTYNNTMNSGYPYCTTFNASDPYYWSDNKLCFNKDVAPVFSTGPITGKQCNTRIIEKADTHDSRWQSGYYLCLSAVPGAAATPPTPKGPPFNSCSNPGTEIDPKACAGEIFEFSPTLYLSSPTVNPPGGGSLQFQSITSLPPVL